MTPGEIAARYGGLHSSEARGYLVDAIRAAIAERDAEWVGALIQQDNCGHAMWRYERDAQTPIFFPQSDACHFCKAIRALLEVAARSAPGERTE